MTTTPMRPDDDPQTHPYVVPDLPEDDPAPEPATQPDED